MAGFPPGQLGQVSHVRGAAGLSVVMRDSFDRTLAQCTWLITIDPMSLNCRGPCRGRWAVGVCGSATGAVARERILSWWPEEQLETFDEERVPLAGSWRSSSRRRPEFLRAIPCKLETNNKIPINDIIGSIGPLAHITALSLLFPPAPSYPYFRILPHTNSQCRLSQGKHGPRASSSSSCPRGPTAPTRPPMLRPSTT